LFRRRVETAYIERVYHGDRWTFHYRSLSINQAARRDAMKWAGGLLLGVFVTACGGTPSSPSSSIGFACGEERFAVKTLSDADARRVNLTPVFTTVAKLTSHLAHCEGGPDRRVYNEEFQTYEVIGRVEIVRVEDDHDYHVVLSDLIDRSITMITEVVEPACEGAASSPFVSVLRAARAAFLNLFAGRTASSLVGRIIRVRGIGFYDFNHGQTGRARNCLELHPVLSIRATP
jgi:hypothetical protein